MRFFITAIFFVLMLGLCGAAQAGQAEVRDVAIANNCPPKKIEIYQNLLGSQGKVIYQVTCNMPKMAGSDTASGPDAVLIGCDQSLCELIRPVSADKK